MNGKRLYYQNFQKLLVCRVANYCQNALKCSKRRDKRCPPEVERDFLEKVAFTKRRGGRNMELLKISSRTRPVSLAGALTG